MNGRERERRQTIVMEGTDDVGVDALGNAGSGLDVVSTVNHDLRLNNGSQAVGLADGSVAGEAPSLLFDEEGGGLAVLDVNAVGSAPLGKAGTGRVVLLATLSETIETSAGRLTISARKGLEALVNLDANEDSLGAEEVSKGLARLGLLEESLLVEDHTRNVLLKAWDWVRQRRE